MEENDCKVTTRSRPLKGEDNISVKVVKILLTFLQVWILFHGLAVSITIEFHSVPFQSKLKY
jgi:hypothetical protein